VSWVSIPCKCREQKKTKQERLHLAHRRALGRARLTKPAIRTARRCPCRCCRCCWAAVGQPHHVAVGLGEGQALSEPSYYTAFPQCAHKCTQAKPKPACVVLAAAKRIKAAREEGGGGAMEPSGSKGGGGVLQRRHVPGSRGRTRRTRRSSTCALPAARHPRRRRRSKCRKASRKCPPAKAAAARLRARLRPRQWRRRRPSSRRPAHVRPWRRGETAGWPRR
jgi:hypothetical protein